MGLLGNYLSKVVFLSQCLIWIDQPIFARSSLSDKSDITEKAVDVSTKRDKPVVRPEEIPPVPENRFLLRRDVPVVNVEPEP